MLNDTGVVPPEGNQPKPMARTSIRTSPIQKVGRANVEREADTVGLSRIESRLLDATITRSTPIIMARVIQDSSSSRGVFWPFCFFFFVCYGLPFLKDSSKWEVCYFCMSG